MWHHAGHRTRIACRPFSKGGLLVLLASAHHILSLIEGVTIYDPPPPLTANIPPTDWETVLESVKNLVPGKALKVSDYQYGRSVLPVPGAKAGQVQYALYPTTRIAAHTFECSTDGSQDGKPVITYRRPHERIYLGHVVIEQQNDRETSPGLVQGTHPASNSSLPPKPSQTPIETTTSALQADAIPFLPSKLRGQAKTLPMTHASKEVAASARTKASKEVAGTAINAQDEATRQQASIIAKELSDYALSNGMTIAIGGKPHPQDFKGDESRDGRQTEVKKDFIGSTMEPHMNQPRGRDVPNQDSLQKKADASQSSVRIFDKGGLCGSYQTKTTSISDSTLGEGSNAVREPGKQDDMPGQVRDYHSSVASSRRQKIKSDDVESQIERTSDVNEKISTSEISEHDNLLSMQKDNLELNNQEHPEDAKISGKLGPPEASQRSGETILTSANTALNDHNPKPGDDVIQPEKKVVILPESKNKVKQDSFGNKIETPSTVKSNRSKESLPNKSLETIQKDIVEDRSTNLKKNVVERIVGPSGSNYKEVLLNERSRAGTENPKQVMSGHAQNSDLLRTPTQRQKNSANIESLNLRSSKGTPVFLTSTVASEIGTVFTPHTQRNDSINQKEVPKILERLVPIINPGASPRNQKKKSPLTNIELIQIQTSGKDLIPGETKVFVPLEENKGVEKDSIKDIIPTHNPLQGHHNEILPKTKSEISGKNVVNNHRIPIPGDGVSPVSSTMDLNYRNTLWKQNKNSAKEKKKKSKVNQAQNHDPQEVPVDPLGTKNNQNNHAAVRTTQKPLNQVTSTAGQNDLDSINKKILVSNTWESYLSVPNKVSEMEETGTNQPKKYPTEDLIHSDFGRAQKKPNLKKMTKVKGVTPDPNHFGNAQDHATGEKNKEGKNGLINEEKQGNNKDPQGYKKANLGAITHDNPYYLPAIEKILDYKIPENTHDFKVPNPENQDSQGISGDEKKEGNFQEDDPSHFSEIQKTKGEIIIQSAQENLKHQAKVGKARKKKKLKNKKKSQSKDLEIKEDHEEYSSGKYQKNSVDDFKNYLKKSFNISKDYVMKEENIVWDSDFEFADKLVQEIEKMNYSSTKSIVFQKFKSAFYPGGSKLKENEIFPGMKKIMSESAKGTVNDLEGDMNQYAYKDTKSQSSKTKQESENELHDGPASELNLDMVWEYLKQKGLDAYFIEILAKHLCIGNRSSHLPLFDMSLYTYNQISNMYHKSATEFMKAININLLLIGFYEGMRRVNTMIKQISEITIVENWKLIRKSLTEKKEITKEDADSIENYYRLSIQFPNPMYPGSQTKPMFKPKVQLDILNSLGIFKSKRHKVIHMNDFSEKKDSKLWSSRVDLYWCSRFYGVDMELVVNLAREYDLDSKLDILNSPIDSYHYLIESTKGALLPWPVSPERRWLLKTYGKTENDPRNDQYLNEAMFQSK